LGESNDALDAEDSASVHHGGIPPDLAQGIWLILSLWVAGLLLFAGVTKLRDPGLFADQIRSYEIVGDPLVALVALVLPPLEVLVAVSLFIPALRRGACLAGVGLAAVFLVALSSAWARDLDISCGCFGSSGKTDYPSAILLDLSMLIPLLLLPWLWKCSAKPK